jgi:hypothetical protein
MERSRIYIECEKNLRRRAQGTSLRALAAELGYPPCKAAMLSHVLSGDGRRARHVSRRTLDDLRRRLGIYHKRAPRRNISLSQEAFERANALRGRKKWDEWVTRGG